MNYYHLFCNQKLTNLSICRIMYCILLLLTTILSCILIAPGLEDSLGKVPFCKKGDGVERSDGNFFENLQKDIQSKVIESF